MVKETKKSGLSFYFAFDWYDPDGMCVRTWGDGGIYERKITYDEANHFTVVDDGRGGRTHYWGNPGGLVDRDARPDRRRDEVRVAPASSTGRRPRSTGWATARSGRTTTAATSCSSATRSATRPAGRTTS